MSDLTIAVCGNDGCVLFMNHVCCETDSDGEDFFEKDPLLKKVIKSKLKMPDTVGKCKLKCLGKTMCAVIYGNNEETKSASKIIRDDLRNCRLQHNNSITLSSLCEKIGFKIHQSNFKSHTFQIILATWTNTNGAELYFLDSYGERFKCCLYAIGSESKNVNLKLSKMKICEKSVQEIVERIFRKFGDNFKVFMIGRDTDGEMKSFCD
jgi:Proteasome subunit